MKPNELAVGTTSSRLPGPVTVTFPTEPASKPTKRLWMEAVAPPETVSVPLPDSPTVILPSEFPEPSSASDDPAPSTSTVPTACASRPTTSSQHRVAVAPWRTLSVPTRRL